MKSIIEQWKHAILVTTHRQQVFLLFALFSDLKKVQERFLKRMERRQTASTLSLDNTSAPEEGIRMQICAINLFSFS